MGIKHGFRKSYQLNLLRPEEETAEQTSQFSRFILQEDSAEQNQLEFDDFGQVMDFLLDELLIPKK